MEIYEAIFRRRDVRAEYTGQPLDDAVLHRILEAGHAAPSVGNSQPWDFVIVRDPARLEEFADHVAGRRAAFANSLPADRKDVFNPCVFCQEVGGNQPHHGGNNLSQHFGNKYTPTAT